MYLDMWLLKALFLLLWCSGFWCDDCNLAQLHFESRNFHSVLRWEEVKSPGREVRYSVQYHEYGTSYMPVTGCQNILEPSCDLSSVMMDMRSKYFLKIMDNETCLGELSYLVPLEKISLEAPALSALMTESSLTVTLTTPPMGPRNQSINNITCWENCQNSGKSSVNYIVSLTQPKSEAGKVFQNPSGLITLSHLDGNTKYCGVALYELTHPSIKLQSENATFCVTSAAAGKPWLSIFIMSALVAFFLLIIVVLIICHQHVTRKRNLPKALQIMSMKTTPNFNPDPKVEIATVSVNTQSLWNPIKSVVTFPDVQVESKAKRNAGYAAQDYHDQDWHCRSYTNEKEVPVSDRSAESCTSYSMVVGVMAHRDRDELSSCANDSGLGDSISPGLSSCTEDDLFQVIPNAEPEDLDLIEPDSTSELLVLPVSRGADGKLLFSGLPFQPLASISTHSSEITPLVGSSTPTGERTNRFLTDLVLTDESDWPDNESDYRNTYLPNRVPQTSLKFPFTETISKALLSDCTSTYRENWVPGILPNLPYNRNCIGSDNQLHQLTEPEHNVTDLPSELESIFLDGWMVQIQG